MNVLVDTSVWAGHFRHRNATLAKLLLSDRVLTHPMVVAELACGTPPSPRTQTLSDIGLLEPANQASIAEVRILIEQEKLYGLGCGLVDIALLASTLITPGAQLWTLDKRLVKLAERFDMQYSVL
ncbi:type II toxin-antitoxin system VapC family toxin [Marinobacter gelidimuriae]|uniref:type II toxin-antitoxin system VapC family toxin n=1 Tax=Marinobacter gelidimuriae TaxID=2739064 RepID=UPI00037EDE40|nr:PIN domain-containing protein [Marinobacter gelidimuriae]